MENQNSMLGLLGMESTSFLEELTRSDDLSPMPGAPANGTILQSGDPGGGNSVEMQQRQQMQVSMWGIGQQIQGSTMYGSQEHVQFGALKQQQQRMGQIGGYGSSMMPAGNGGVMQTQSGGNYVYGGMTVNPQQQQHHNMAMTPPRQMIASNQMWNQSPSAMTSDQTAASYQGMQSGHAAMSQQHVGMMAQMQAQGSVGVNRTNGMGGAQMYGPYHSEYGANITGQTAHQGRGMVGYNDSQSQQVNIAIPGGGFCQQTPPMSSPPPASNRLAQMSMMSASGVAAARMPGSSGPYQQHHYQPMQGGSGGLDSSSFMVDAQSTHGAAGHQMNQAQSYQYLSGGGNGMMSGQAAIPSDTYGQFYGHAQPLYRMQSYPAAVTQPQMLSPGSVQPMSSPSRASSVRPQQHAQSPTPVAAPVRLGVVGANATSVPFRQNVPRQSYGSSPANVSVQVSQQRMMMNDVASVNYVQPGGSVLPGPSGPSASSSIAGMMNAGSRYTTPGYQLNSVPGTPQMISSGATEVSHIRPVYNVPPQQQVNMIDMQDRMRTYQQQQQYQQIYYQQQQGPQQQVQLQMTAQHQQQQQQQQQLMMMTAGVSPSQLTPQQPVPQISPSGSTGESSGACPVPNNMNFAVVNQSPPYISPPQLRAVSQTVSADLDPSGAIEAPTLHLPDMRMQFSGQASSMSASPPALTISVSTRDDEPLSTPPPLDVPDDASCTFYASQTSQSTVVQNVVPARTNTTDILDETVTEENTCAAMSEDIVAVESPEKKIKKKRKRKSEAIEGDTNGEAAVIVKKARKKKPKTDVLNVDDVVPEVCEVAAEAPQDVSELDSAGLDSSALETSAVVDSSLIEDARSECPVLEVEEDDTKPPQDLEIDISVPMKPKKGSKHSKTLKEPKIRKEKKESKEHKEKKVKDTKTPKEPKTPKEMKSGRSSKKNKTITKALDISDEGTVLGSVTDVNESLQEEQLDPEIPEQKVKLKPAPRPKSKKKRPLPTFLKNKKKRKSGVSDVSDVEHTPPSSPADDSLKRRSSRVTKRQKYMEDAEMSDEDRPIDADIAITDALTIAVAVEENPADEDAQIVEKFLSSRIVKRKINLKTGLYIEDAKDKASTTDVKKCTDLLEPQNSEEKEAPPADLDDLKKDDTAIKDENMKHDDDDDAKPLDDAAETEAPFVSNDVEFTMEAKKESELAKQVIEEEVALQTEDIAEVEVEEFYVKYKNFSYLHCEWRTAEELELGDKRVMQKIKRYKQKKSMQTDYLAQIDEEELFNPDYVEVDRVLDVKAGDECAHYLVKWRSLPYDESTWELAADIDSDKIQAFLHVNEPLCESERKFKSRPGVKEWKTLEETPVYKNTNTLREYQLEGLNWLTFCYYSKQNCILADEMGLGKTIQSITFLEHVFSYGIRGPFLVIVPLSTLGNWQREFEAWTDLNVIVYHGSSASRNMLQQYEMFYKDEKGRRIPDIYRFHALVTTYEVIISDLELLRQIDWRVAVIDEAHRLKNRNCKLLQGLSCFDVEHRVLLTGTPLQNNVEELFSLLNFLEPKQFTSSEAFMADFGKLESETQVEKLKALLKPMMLRRLKEDVEKSLAPKEETIIEVELTNIQKKYYRAILERNFSFLAKGGTTSNIPNLMNTMMELRKCCNHPYLINGAEDQVLEELRGNSRSLVDLEKMFVTMVHSSGKLVLIDKLLPKLKADGHKVLIFSQMIRVLDIIEDYIIHKKYLYERIDGRIRGNMRQEAIDRFSKPDSDRFIFLLCTRAGGLGINLTAADTVIIYDSDWNPQNDLQAQARCHRIGQQKSVKVYRLITRNTYEREMFDRASLKLGLDKAVLQSMGTKDLGASSQLSKKEIEDLLKKGAYGALMEDDTAGNDFCEEDIDHILQRRTQIVQIEAGVKGSTFAKASFSLTTNRNDIDIDDPEFWQKWAKKADVDAASLLTNKNDLIIEMPRQRKQVCRYGKQDEAVRISDLETSDSEVEEDENNGPTTDVPGQRSVGGKRKRRGARDKDFDDVPFVPDNAREGFSRSDCFTVEKNLLVFGWGRWIDIQKHGHFKRRLEIDDIRTISRAMLIFSLQHYEGDDRIKMFIFDLVSSAVDGQEKDYRNHTGLSAPVPRGRKGRRGKKVEPSTPPKKSQFCEDLSKLDIDANVILADPGYRKHLQRHAIKLLLRVRLLYYLKQEVIGAEADKVMSGAPASEINVVMPIVDGDIPVYWWDTEADRCMVIAVFKHGYEKYNQMRQDPGLCFLIRCGPPDGNALLAEEIDNEDEMKDDDEDDDQQTPRRRGGRPKKENSYANLDDIDDVGTPNSSKAPSVTGPPNSDATVTPTEIGKLPFPGMSDLNARLRRIVAAFQKNHKKELLKQEQNEKRLMRREQFDIIIKQREEARVVALQNHWSRREEADFYRVVSTFGIERDWKTIDFQWEKFRALARLDKKRDEALTEYFRAFYQMCTNVCRRTNADENARKSSGQYIEPITEERANRCLARIDLLCKIREQVLHHPLLDERLKLCQSSTDMPDWWVPGMHDRDLLVGAARHGLSRTDYHIQYDPQLTFRQFVRERRGRTSRSATLPAGQNVKEHFESSELKPDDVAAEVKSDDPSAVNVLKSDTLETVNHESTARTMSLDLVVKKEEITESQIEDGALNLVKMKKCVNNELVQNIDNIEKLGRAENAIEKKDGVTNNENNIAEADAIVVMDAANSNQNSIAEEDAIGMKECVDNEVVRNDENSEKLGRAEDAIETKDAANSNQNSIVKEDAIEAIDASTSNQNSADKEDSIEIKDAGTSNQNGAAKEDCIEMKDAATCNQNSGAKEDDDETLSESDMAKDSSVNNFASKSKPALPKLSQHEVDGTSLLKDEIDDELMDRSAVTSPCPENPGGEDGDGNGGEYPVTRWSNQWPKDRVIFHRLENICHCIERGEWPVSHRYFTPVVATADSHSSTPMPGTPTSTTPLMALASAECSSGAGSNSIMAALDRLHEGPKLPFQQQRRRRRTKAEMEADRMKRMREIIAASMSGSSLDAAAGHCRRVLEGEDDSGTSSNELRRPEPEMIPVIRRRRGRRPKIEKLLEASAIESAMAASGGNLAAGLTCTLPSSGLVGNMLWPGMSPAGFEQCLNRFADSVGLTADSRRMFISELSRVTNLDDRSSLVGGGLLTDKNLSAIGNERSIVENMLHKPEGPSVSETERRIHEVVSSVKRAHQLDVESGATQEYEQCPVGADDRHIDDDQQSPRGAAIKTRTGRRKHVAKDSAREDDESPQPMNLVSAEQDAFSEKERNRSSHVDGHGQFSRHEVPGDRGSLQRECIPSGEASREHSRYSAGEEEEDMLARARMNHPEHEAVSRWLAEHRNAFDRQAVEDELELALGQRQRRRPRLDPAKIDVNHVSGDENVSVINRSTGKRITGAKAPPIRYLKEWLLRNPEFDVDPKWGHIVKAKGNLPEDMQSRVLMPSGRGRRSNAAIAAAAAMSTTSSPVPQPSTASSDFFNTLASLSAMTGGSSAAASLMGYAGMPYTLGLGALGLTNPMYAASLASLGILPGMAALSGLDGSGEAEKDMRDGKGDKGGSSKDKEHHGTSAENDELGAGSSSSIHPSFPYMYNPLLFNPLYAQSLAAAASNFTLPGPFGALGLGLGGAMDSVGLADEPPKAESRPPKSRRVTESPAPSKSRERERNTSESYRKSYGESNRGRQSDEPSQMRDTFGDAGSGGVDQAEPEDLSVLSSKRSKVTSDLTTGGRTSSHDDRRMSRLAAAEACDEVEDLSKKLLPTCSPVILTVPESKSIVSKARRSPSPQHVSTLAVDHPVSSARESVPSNKPERSRSRLIDSIGTKLMAKRQKVQTDVSDLSKLVDESGDSAMCPPIIQPVEQASSCTATASEATPEIDSSADPTVLGADVTAPTTENCATDSVS